MCIYQSSYSFYLARPNNYASPWNVCRLWLVFLSLRTIWGITLLSRFIKAPNLSKTNYIAVGSVNQRFISPPLYKNGKGEALDVQMSNDFSVLFHMHIIVFSRKLGIDVFITFLIYLNIYYWISMYPHSKYMSVRPHIILNYREPNRKVFD